MDWLKSKKGLILKKRDEEFKIIEDKRKPKIIRKVEHQIGSTNKIRDIVRKALPPGKRISKSGKIYYEYRKNRTDLTGSNI